MENTGSVISLTRYTNLLQAGEVREIFAASLIGRLPIGITGLAILLFVQTSRGSFAEGGAAAACYVGGLSVAAAAAAFGVPVVLIEKGKMGGDCLNYGCVPSKALLAAAKHAVASRRVTPFGLTQPRAEVDFAKVHAHVHGVIATALQEIEREHGCLRVEDVAERCGVSPRHLHRLMRVWVGYGPKRYATVVRFQATLHEMEHAPARPVAALAVQNGYFDQAHLTLDVARFAGATPGLLASAGVSDFSKTRCDDLP
jgi:AraC-like DNA-binding protein